MKSRCLARLGRYEEDDAVKGYAQHPDHLAVANGKVRPYTVSRACLDFEI